MIDFAIFLLCIAVFVWLCGYTDGDDHDAISEEESKTLILQIKKLTELNNCSRMNDLRDYVDEHSRLSDTSSKAWGEMGDDEQKAYRLGMVYAYLDMRRQLGPKEGI